MTYKKNTRKRNKKGGWFWSKKIIPDDCNPSNLSSLKTTEDMHANYQKCCPRGIFRKNSSPYCKHLDLNINSEYNKKNNAYEIIEADSTETVNSSDDPVDYNDLNRNENIAPDIGDGWKSYNPNTYKQEQEIKEGIPFMQPKMYGTFANSVKPKKFWEFWKGGKRTHKRKQSKKKRRKTMRKK